jgi:hypothetical protein
MRAAAISVAISAKSMYVAPKQASKTPAGTPPSNPRRIIRKLRLALLQRSCRLPLGARQTSRLRKTPTFSRDDYEMSGLGGIQGIGGQPRGYTRTSLPKPAIFRAICNTSSATPANLTDYPERQRSNRLDLRTIFRLQTTEHRITRSRRLNRRELFGSFELPRRLAKYGGLRNKESGGRSPRAFACERGRQPRQAR